MSLPNLELDAFFKVYTLSSVQKASFELGVTPTAITQRLKSLEANLGLSLFIRSKKGMVPTSEAHELAQFYKEKTELEDNVLSKIAGNALNNPISIKFVASGYFTYNNLLPLTEDLNKKYPNLYFNFDVSDNKNKLELLKSNKADFVIMPRSEVPLEYDSKLLKEKKYVLVGGERYKKDKIDLTIIDFSNQDPFTLDFLQFFNIEFDKNKPRHFINNTLMIPKLIESNLGVAVLDYYHYLEAKKTYNIFNLYPKKVFEIEWALVWHYRKQMPEYLKEIVERVK